MVTKWTTMKLGDFTLSFVSDGEYWLDGGAMHSVVPRSLWEKHSPPDEQNRILCALNCLLIETPRERLLAETGIGIHHSEKFASTFGISKKASLLDSLAAIDVKPETIQYVIHTHLHFDHMGGCMDWSQNRLLLPEPTHIIQRKEWDHAMNPHPRGRVSYQKEILEAYARQAKTRQVWGDTEIVRGVRVLLTGGHTHGHQVVLIESKGERACFFGDLIPMVHYLNPLWIMSFDCHPEVTIDQKLKLLNQGVEERWLALFYHEPRQRMGFIKKEGEKFYLEPAGTLIPG